MSDRHGEEARFTPPSPPTFGSAKNGGGSESGGSGGSSGGRPAPLAEDGTITARKKGVGLKFFLQVSISLAALIFILKKAHLGEVVDEMREANILWLFLASLMALTGISIASWRWGRLMRSLGIDAPFTLLFRSYLVGTFFNVFLPTNVGGDVVRASDIAKVKGCGGARALTIIILDRLTGVVGMFVLAVPAVFFKLGDIGAGGRTPKWLIASFPILAVVLFFGGGYVLTHPAVVKRLLALFEKIPVVNKFSSKFAMMFETTAICHDRPSIMIVQVFLAVLLQLNVVVHCWLLGMAYGIDLSFIHYLWIVPLWILVPMFIPALGGHGVREATAVFLMVILQKAAPMSVVVAWSLTYAIMQAMWGLVGAGLFATRAAESKRGKFAAFSAVGLTAIAAAAVFLALPEKPKPRDNPAQKFVFCCGDSLTYSSYPAEMQEMLNNFKLKQAREKTNDKNLASLPFKPYKVWEKGKQGFNSGELLRHLQTKTWLLRYDPDIVVLQFGTNDVRETAHKRIGVEQFVDHAKKMIERVRKQKYTEGRKPRIILCTVPPLKKFGGQLSKESERRIEEELNPALRRLAAAEGVTLVDLYAAFAEGKAEPSPLLTTADLEKLQNGDKLYAADGVHLNDDGYRFMAKLIGGVILRRPEKTTAAVAPGTATGQPVGGE